MSLSLDQLFLSPNEEKKVQLQNRPYVCDIGDSSDECSDEEKTKRSHQSINRKIVNHRNENKIENRKEHSKIENLSKNEIHTNSENRLNYFQYQSKDQTTNQSNYAAFSSNQIRNKKEMSNLNYPVNLTNHKQLSSTSKQNDRIKYRKSYYNDQDDYEPQSTQDDLLTSNQNDETKNQVNDLTNQRKTPASALIKKGNLFKNVDYFNRSSVAESDEDLYNDRKIERRKARKYSSQDYSNILQPESDYVKKKEYLPKEYLNKQDARQIDKRNRDYLIRPNDKSQQLNENYENYQNRTRFVNENGNYHYVQKDANSKRASVSSADISISKGDTQSSSSSDSPIQDRKADLNEIICFENKYIDNPQPNYIGFDLETVMRESMNRKINSKELVYSSANSSILDEDTNLILENIAANKPKRLNTSSSSCSNQKLSALNDLLTIENDLTKSSVMNDHDTFMNTDFSSSIMHKSSSSKQIKTSNDRKSSIEKDFNLVDFINKENKSRESSPELLKFNDEDYNQQHQFVNNYKKTSDDLLTDDNLSLNELKDQPVINLISSAQAVLQPKIINNQFGKENVNKSSSNESNDQVDRLMIDAKTNPNESDSNIIQINYNNNDNENNLNNLINEIDEIESDEDKDDGIGSSDLDQNELAFAQLPIKVQQIKDQRRKSSGESCNLKDDFKEQSTIIYSTDFKINPRVNSQSDSPTTSESTFNSTVITMGGYKTTNVPQQNTVSKQQQNTSKNLNTESSSSVTSLDGISPKRNGLKTPGYTQRIILNSNSNSEQIKFGLFQLGTNNLPNNLMDIDIEHNESEKTYEHKEDDKSNSDHLLQQLSSANKKSTNQKQQSTNQTNSSTTSIQRDISRDELVKSILNIPFSKYDSLDQMDDENLDRLSKTQSSHQSSQNSSLNSSHNKSHFSNRNLETTQQLANDLENLNLSDNIIKSAQQVTNRNESLGDVRLNNSSTCKQQLKDSTSVNSNQDSVNNLNKSNLKISRQSSNTSLEQENIKCKNSGSISNSQQTSSIDGQSNQNLSDLSDCLDLVLDKSLANNINFVSNSMSNSNLLNSKSTSTKLNGRLVDYMLDNSNKMDSQKNDKQSNFNLLDDEPINKSDKNDKNDFINNQENKQEKEELLIDTSDITIPTSSNQSKYDKSNYSRNETFGQQKMQSKILQNTVYNHLLSDSLIDVGDELINSNQFEQQFHQSNKKSPKKQRAPYNSDLCYLETNNHSTYANRIIEKNYSSSSRNILNSKFNSAHFNNKHPDSIRNFSLSPETTDCESVEVESEFSISSFIMPVPGLNQMPILEDGLSSGSASDTETSQTKETDRLKKREQQNKLIKNSESPQMEIFAKCRPRVKKNQHMSDYDMNSENYNSCDNSNLCDEKLSDGRRLKKSRSLNLNNVQLNNGLDSSETEHTNENLTSEQLWNAKLQQQTHQPQQQPNRGHLDYNQSAACENQSDNEVVSNSLLELDDEKPKLTEKTFHEDDCDTDTETDRLLGAQRSEDRPFYEDKNQPVKKKSNSKEDAKPKRPSLSHSVLIEGVLFRARYLGSTQLICCEGAPTKAIRMMQAQEAVHRIKAPEGETQPSTEVDLFISTEKIMVLNTDLKEIMMDHTLRMISYIADIGELLVLMAKRRQLLPTANDMQNNSNGNDKIKRSTPKMICHVFESEEAQYIAQSIGQAFQVAYMEYLKQNGIEDSSFVKEMDYQEVLNSQEIAGNELEMFAQKEKQKEVIIPKKKGEILGMVILESGWGSMLPTVVIANMAQQLPAARCGLLNIGDQIIAINGISLVGLPLNVCQNYIKNAKNQTAVKLTVVPCAPVVEVKIKRPDTKYQLGFSVQNGVIFSLLRGGIAERGGVRVGHRIIEINGQSVVAVPHDKIVSLLATSVGEIHMKTMPTSMFKLLTGQEVPVFQ